MHDAARDRGEPLPRSDRGWERLAHLVEGPTEAEEATPEYARFRTLLPEVVAGTLDPGGADYQWFLSYLDQCPPCRDEYEDLAMALAAEQAAWADSAPVREAEHATAIWTARVRTDLSAAWHAGRVALQAHISAVLGSAPPLQVRPTAGTEPPPPALRTLFSEAVALDPQRPAERCILTVQAERTDALNCRLLVSVDGPGVIGRQANLAVTVRPADTPEQVARTDAGGVAEFSLPIAMLTTLTVIVEVPVR
jgi:hypothetical protein